MTGPQSRSWTWSLQESARRRSGRCWPIRHASTKRRKLPRHTITEIPQGLDGSGRLLRRGEDRPLRHSAGRNGRSIGSSEQFFEHIRDFSSGPLGPARRASPDRGRPDRKPVAPIGTYTLTCHARETGSAALLLGHQILQLPPGEAFGQAWSPRPTGYAAGETPTIFTTYAAPAVTRGDCRPRSRGMVTEIEATPNGHGLARAPGRSSAARRRKSICGMCGRIGLARGWQVPERHAIELCLQAVKVGPAGTALGHAVSALPRGEGLVGRPRPFADRCPLFVLQHRLRPRLHEERRGELPPCAGDPASGIGRILHVGPDVGAACAGADLIWAPARAAILPGRLQRRSLSPAHAGAGTGMRYRA